MATDATRGNKGWTWYAKRALLGLGLGAAGFAGWVYGATEQRMQARYDVQVAPLAIPMDDKTVARGEHVVRAIAKCTDCHGEDLAGGVLVDDPMAGRLSAPNLTPAGPVAHRSDADLLKALTHGVSPEGRPLRLMPSREIAELGEEDLAAVIAYVRSLPPVARETPPLRLGPALRVMMALDKAELLSAERIDHDRPRAPRPIAEPTAAYGAYLAKSGGCYGCHGPTLAGGPMPGMPPGTPVPTDIRPQALAAWTFEDFDRALRNGKRPDGRQLAELMPWRATARMTDLEMRALYAHLHGEAAERGPTASAP